MALESLPGSVQITFFFIFGAVFGSFANVLILRIPLEKSIVKPGSQCQSCHRDIKWFDNIPILSWIFLSGKCRGCDARFSVRYPFIELLMGVLFSLVFLRAGYSVLLLSYLCFTFALVVVSFIDIDHMILPDRFTLSGILIGVAFSFFVDEISLYDSILGVLLGGGVLWLVAYLYYVVRKEEGMGGGDIKLLAWIGAVLGWQSLAMVLLISCVIGALFGAIMLSKTKAGLKTVIPFGPYLAFAAIVNMLWGAELSKMYINFFMPGLLPN